jgi:hypothetical protein
MRKDREGIEVGMHKGEIFDIRGKRTGMSTTVTIIASFRF